MKLTVLYVVVVDAILVWWSRNPSARLDLPLAAAKCYLSNRAKLRPRNDPLRFGRARGSFGHLHASSPAIRWCRAVVAASWAAIRRTATNADGDHVVNRRMNMADAMMLGRGQGWEGVAENNCGGKRNFCRAQHVLSPGWLNPQ
jgi:hypothetical protein